MEKINENKKLTPVIDNFESAVKVWKKNLRNFILVYWQGLKWALIPLGIILLSSYLVGSGESISVFVLSLNAFIVLTAFLLSFYFIVRAQISLFIYIKNAFKGEPSKIFQESKKYFWPYLGLSLLTAILILLWTLLLIIPGIIFSVFYSLAIYVFFVEDKRGMAAISRSKKLVSGYFWPVLGRILFILFILLIFSSIISLPNLALEEGTDAYRVWDLIMQIISLLVTPIVLVFFYNIYQDLSKIKGNK